MKTLIGIIISIAGLLLALTCPAQGSFVYETDARFWPDSVLKDTQTGLEWLPLAHTTGYSVHGIQTAMQPGGMFSGYKHASMDEVVGLLYSAGLPISGWHIESQLNLQALETFFLTMGVAYDPKGEPRLIGMTGTVPIAFPDLHDVAGVGFQYHTAGRTFGFGDIGLAVNQDYVSPTVGHWLVAVPEPRIFTLLLTGGSAILFLNSTIQRRPRRIGLK